MQAHCTEQDPGNNHKDVERRTMQRLNPSVMGDDYRLNNEDSKNKQGRDILKIVIIY